MQNGTKIKLHNLIKIMKGVDKDGDGEHTFCIQANKGIWRYSLFVASLKNQQKKWLGNYLELTIRYCF